MACGDIEDYDAGCWRELGGMGYGGGPGGRRLGHARVGSGQTSCKDRNEGEATHTTSINDDDGDEGGIALRLGLNPGS